MQIEITMKYNQKKQKITGTGEDVEPSFTSNQNVKWYNDFR